MIAIVFALLCGVPTLAQTRTVVSGTILDPNGVPYAGGTIDATLTPAGMSPTVNGQPIGGYQPPISIDVNGHFTMQLFCNSAGGGCSVISPSGTQWQFHVTNPGAQPPVGFGGISFTLAVTITGATQDLSSTLSAAAPQLYRDSGAAGAITGSGTIGFLPKFTGTGSIGNSLCDEGITTPNTLTCAEAIASKPSGGVGGRIVLPEGTASAGISLSDVIYGDSANHCAHAIFNNIDVGCLVTATGSGFLLNVPLTTAANTIAPPAGVVPLTATVGSTCVDLLDLNANGGSGGNAFKVDCVGDTTTTFGFVAGGNIASFGHIDQGQTKDFAGTCTMVAGTTCTFTLNATYNSTPICTVTEQGTSATVIAAACSVVASTGVATITAATLNSATWGAFVVGNPT